MGKLFPLVVLGVGLGSGYLSNAIYREARIDYLDYRLKQAEAKFEHDFDETKCCACGLVQEINRYTAEVEQEKMKERSRQLNPFYGM